MEKDVMSNIMKCQDCGIYDASERVYMDSDSFAVDYRYLCPGCKVVHYALLNSPLEQVVTDCEISGIRRYLVDPDTKFRVRLFRQTSEGVQDAIQRFTKGLEEGRLYKMP
jgi:transposase-like protein